MRKFRKPRRVLKDLSPQELALAVVVIGGLLATIELTAFLINKITGPQEYVYYSSYMNGFKYHPFVAFAPENLIDPETAKAITGKSLVITGASTAAGVGASDFEHMYFTQLQKLSGWNIVNYATPGYVSNQENAAYKNFVFSAPRAPRVLLALTSFSDLYFYLFREMPAGFHEFSFEFDRVFKSGYPDPDSYWHTFLNRVRKLNTYVVIRKLAHKLTNRFSGPITLSSHFDNPYQPRKDRPPAHEAVELAARNFLDNCLSTALLARERKTRFVVVLQPNIYWGGELDEGKNPFSPDLSTARRWIKDVGVHRDAYAEFFRLVLQGLRGLKSRGLLEYWDYRELFKTAGKVYYDPVHFNDDANLTLAKKMKHDLQGYFGG